MSDFPIIANSRYVDRNGSQVRVLDILRMPSGKCYIAYRWLPHGTISEVTEDRFRQFFAPAPVPTTLGQEPKTFGQALAAALADLETMPPAGEATEKRLRELETRIEKANARIGQVNEIVRDEVAAACERWLEARLKSELTVLATLFNK